MTTETNGDTPLFSRPIVVDSVSEAGATLRLAASPEECAALAELDGVVALRDVIVEAQLKRRGREGLSVKGRVSAIVTQLCVVTLEPFEAPVDESFEVAFAPQAEAEAAYAKAMAEIEAALDKARALAEQPESAGPDPRRQGRSGRAGQRIPGSGSRSASAQAGRAIRRSQRGRGRSQAVALRRLGAIEEGLTPCLLRIRKKEPEG